MDISSRRERELAEARLREERDTILRLAVEASPSGMVMCRADAEGRIVMCNATAEKVRYTTKCTCYTGQQIFPVIVSTGLTNLL